MNCTINCLLKYKYRKYSASSCTLLLRSVHVLVMVRSNKMHRIWSMSRVNGNVSYPFSWTEETGTLSFFDIFKVLPRLLFIRQWQLRITEKYTGGCTAINEEMVNWSAHTHTEQKWKHVVVRTTGESATSVWSLNSNFPLSEYSP